MTGHNTAGAPNSAPTGTRRDGAGKALAELPRGRICLREAIFSPEQAGHRGARSAHHRGFARRRPARRPARPTPPDTATRAAGARSLTSSSGGRRAPGRSSVEQARVQAASRASSRPGQPQPVRLSVHLRRRQRVGQRDQHERVLGQRWERRHDLPGPRPEHQPGRELARHVGPELPRRSRPAPRAGPGPARRPGAGRRRRRPSLRPFPPPRESAWRSRSSPAAPAQPRARSARQRLGDQVHSRHARADDLVRLGRASSIVLSDSSSASETDSNSVTSRWRPSSRV